jgi:hypothetical protein
VVVTFYPFILMDQLADKWPAGSFFGAEEHRSRGAGVLPPPWHPEGTTDRTAGAEAEVATFTDLTLNSWRNRSRLPFSSWRSLAPRLTGPTVDSSRIMQ